MALSLSSLKVAAAKLSIPISMNMHSLLKAFESFLILYQFVFTFNTFATYMS